VSNAISDLSGLSGQTIIRAILFAGVLSPGAAFGQVPYDRIVKAESEPANWLTYAGSYKSQRYTQLDQINKQSVKGLQLVWARTMEAGINEATPIVYKGVMFLGNPNDVVQAIDAASGDLLWQYRRNLPPDSGIRRSHLQGLRGQQLTGIIIAQSPMCIRQCHQSLRVSLGPPLQLLNLQLHLLP